MLGVYLTQSKDITKSIENREKETNTKDRMNKA